MKHLIFTLGKEYFGVPVNQAREVMKVSPIHPLPESPSFIEGVVSTRDQNLAVIDLAKRFQILSDSPGQHLLIAKLNRLVVALLVEKVTEVVDLTVDAQETNVSPLKNEKIMSGIFKMGEKLITRLDLSKLLNSEEEKELIAYRG